MGFGSRVQMMVKKVCSYKVISLMHKLKAAKAVHQHSVLDVWDSVRYMRLVDWLEATGQYIQVNLELHNTFKADDLGKVFIQLKVVERRKQTRNTGNQAGAGPQEVPIRSRN
ncbi:hypothetical protein pipiens_006197 [Culex pipiens pipiens]|uniref:Uncharacterized protein n=1 Tax=Culex pipiens pipiens TaxID=38569 RepID=A0ABD1DR30_CULPP